MKKSGKEKQNSELAVPNYQFEEGAYLQAEDVMCFDHALTTLEQAIEILQTVAENLQPAGELNNNC